MFLPLFAPLALAGPALSNPQSATSTSAADTAIFDTGLGLDSSLTGEVQESSNSWIVDTAVWSTVLETAGGTGSLHSGVPTLPPADTAYWNYSTTDSVMGLCSAGNITDSYVYIPIISTGPTGVITSAETGWTTPTLGTDTAVTVSPPTTSTTGSVTTATTPTTSTTGSVTTATTPTTQDIEDTATTDRDQEKEEGGGCEVVGTNLSWALLLLPLLVRRRAG